MPQARLSQAQRQHLAAASPAAIEDAAARLGRYLTHSRWVGANNRYMRRPVKAVEDDNAANGASANPKHLAEYIAASVVLHCADGWSFLGRGIASHARGDINVARHLAYYAELRAAMALLASQGVGVFNRDHVVIDANSTPRFFRGPTTHVMTWLALEYWSDQPAGAARLSSLVCPYDYPLQEWVAALTTGGGWRPLGRQWLLTWGLDLRRFSRDRDARNEASYRPTGIRNLRSLDARDAASYLRELWSVFEPAGNAPFQTIDLYLLRLSLEQAYREKSGQPPTASSADFERAIQGALARTLGEDTAGRLGQFLLRKVDPDDPALIVNAQKRSTHLDPQHHVQVMSRAALLLRVATGIASDLLSDAQLGAGQYNFWCAFLADDRGLSEDQNRSQDFSDLWADVKDALDALGSETRQGADDSYTELLRRCSPALSVLGGCERVLLWSLAA